MRIAALIFGIVVGIIAFFQSIAAAFVSDVVGLLGETESAEDLSSAAGGGMIASLITIVAAGLVLKFPRAGLILFTLAAAIAIPTGATSEFSDLTVWGSLMIVCAVFAFFGQPAPRRWPLSVFAREWVSVPLKVQREERATGSYCSTCGTQVGGQGSFCRACGVGL